MYLLDTNVVSEGWRRRGEPLVKAWLAAAPLLSLYLSVLVIGEIRRGIEQQRRRDPIQAATRERWLDALVRDYAGRILPVTHEIAEEWGRLGARDPIPPIDGLLAATARVHGLILVTRNTADLEGRGVRLLNPWRA